MTRICGVIAVIAALCLTAAAGADDGGHGRGKKKGQHHGDRARLTFTVTTTDHGSCGNVWVNDVVTRRYVVKSNGDGTFTLTRYDRGRFTTVGTVSPGACDRDGRHGHVLAPGKTGRVVGFIRGTVTGGTFNPSATCAAACGATDTFVATFFGASARFSCFGDSADCAFNFEYTADRGQGLLFRHWQDRGRGAGTMLVEQFNGDIAIS